jgi:release factor glutamine methyltransferase
LSVLDKIKLASSPSVYEPSDDSELLAEVVEREAKGCVLDVGTGSGVQAIAAALKPRVTQVTATDVNPAALKLAATNAKANGAASKIRFIESDLFARVPRGASFDCVVFNPPYLPTARGEKVKGKLNSAFDGGGARGRRVTERFLRGLALGRFLKPGGVVLLVQSSLSGFGKTIEQLEKLGFSARVAASRHFFFEEIVVLRGVRRGVLKTRAR